MSATLEQGAVIRIVRAGEKTTTKKQTVGYRTVRTADPSLAMGKTRVTQHGNDGTQQVTYSVGWSAWLDIAPQGVNKATALEKVREWLEIDPSRVVAMGDGRNDIEMLTWAGRGVAMGQAVQPVIDVADAVTGTVGEDGAAQELGRWF